MQNIKPVDKGPKFNPINSQSSKILIYQISTWPQQYKKAAEPICSPNRCRTHTQAPTKVAAHGSHLPPTRSSLMAIKIYHNNHNNKRRNYYTSDEVQFGLDLIGFASNTDSVRKIFYSIRRLPTTYGGVAGTVEFTRRRASMPGRWCWSIWPESEIGIVGSFGWKSGFSLYTEI